MVVVPLSSVPITCGFGVPPGSGIDNNRGNKRIRLFNLSQAGAVLIGNIMCKYEKKKKPAAAADHSSSRCGSGAGDHRMEEEEDEHEEDDIVECLRKGIIGSSKFNIAIERHVEPMPQGIPILSLPKMIFCFRIHETRTTLKQVPLMVFRGRADGEHGGMDHHPYHNHHNNGGGDSGGEVCFAPAMVTEIMPVKTVRAIFTVRTQFLIRRLQMFLRLCCFKMRCHRRRMLLVTTCLLVKDSKTSSSSTEEEAEKKKFTLASLFNDQHGGVFREYVAKWMLQAT